jgi:hypothetical protein
VIDILDEVLIRFINDFAQQVILGTESVCIGYTPT